MHLAWDVRIWAGINLVATRTSVSEIDFDQWFRWNCPVNDTAQRVWLDKIVEWVMRENNQ